MTLFLWQNGKVGNNIVVFLEVVHDEKVLNDMHLLDGCHAHFTIVTV
jgi:hypothetical protein